MIGSLVIEAALAAPMVNKIISVGRRPTPHVANKLEQIDKSDFTKWNDVDLSEIDAVIFCLGAYTGSVSEQLLKEITVDFPVALAMEFKQQNPEGKFVLLSGQGADRKENSRISFARFKGMAENQIADIGLAQFNSFRPSYIYPVTPREEPNLTYQITRYLYPLIKLFGKNFSITSTQLANAMLRAVLTNRPEQIIENKDILEYHNA